MGGNLTTDECYERLGVSVPDRSKFMKKVWDDLCRDCRYGTDLAMAPRDVSDSLKQYLNDDRLARFRRQPVQGRHPQPSEIESHGWLLQLVNERIDKNKEKASQEDPEYSGSSDASPKKTKKRKRTSGQTSFTKASPEKPAKKLHPGHSVKHAFISPQKPRSDIRTLLRSPTADTTTSSLHDIEYRATDRNTINLVDDQSEDEFPSHSQIILDRSRSDDHNQAEPSSSATVPGGGAVSKGKAPVRDPPVTPPPEADLESTIHAANSGVVGTAQAEQLSYPSSEHSEPEAAAEPSHRSPTTARQDGLPSRSFGRLIELEEAENTNDRSPTTVTGFANFNSPTHLYNHPPSTRRPITPPTTARTTKFIDVSTTDPIPFPPIAPSPTNPISAPATLTIPADPATNHNDSDNAASTSHTIRPQQPRDERLLTLITNLLEYVQQCEQHNIATASDPSRSHHEQGTSRVRAKTLFNLRADLESRVQAFLDADEGDGGAEEREREMERKVKAVTSYCLWS